MEEIIWSKLALADLDRIHDFIALCNQSFSRQVQIKPIVTYIYLVKILNQAKIIFTITLSNLQF